MGFVIIRAWPSNFDSYFFAHTVFLCRLLLSVRKLCIQLLGRQLLCLCRNEWLKHRFKNIILIQMSAFGFCSEIVAFYYEKEKNYLFNFCIVSCFVEMLLEWTLFYPYNSKKFRNLGWSWVTNFVYCLRKKCIFLDSSSFVSYGHEKKGTFFLPKSLC